MSDNNPSDNNPSGAYILPKDFTKQSQVLEIAPPEPAHGRDAKLFNNDIASAVAEAAIKREMEQTIEDYVIYSPPPENTKVSVIPNFSPPRPRCWGHH